MPSFKSMEISKELSNDNRLSIKNSLFGILSKVTYQPTHSKIVSKKIEYTQEDGGKLERAINANADNRCASSPTWANFVKLTSATIFWRFATPKTRNLQPCACLDSPRWFTSP